jgi:hypothetical protein
MRANAVFWCHFENERPESATAAPYLSREQVSQKSEPRRWPRSRNHSWTCALEIFRTRQFTTFYFFSRLFDTYSVPSNYVYAGLIQVSARIRSPG